MIQCLGKHTRLRDALHCLAYFFRMHTGEIADYAQHGGVAKRLAETRVRRLARLGYLERQPRYRITDKGRRYIEHMNTGRLS